MLGRLDDRSVSHWLERYVSPRLVAAEHTNILAGSTEKLRSAKFRILGWRQTVKWFVKTRSVTTTRDEISLDVFVVRIMDRELEIGRV